MARGQDKSDKGGREEHLNDRDVAIVAAEDLGEGIGVVDAEAFRGTCWSGDGLAAQSRYESLQCEGEGEDAGIPTARHR